MPGLRGEVQIWNLHRRKANGFAATPGVQDDAGILPLLESCNERSLRALPFDVDSDQLIGGGRRGFPLHGVKV